MMLTYPNNPLGNHASFRMANNRDDHKSLQLAIYESELHVIASEALKYWKDENETGGTLHGLKTRSNESVIMLATPPGKDAYHSMYRFQMDLPFLRQVDKFVKDNYEVDHHGDWHSHIIDLPRPSPDDIDNTNNISRKNNYDHYIQFIITIQCCGRKEYIKFNPYIYADAKYGLPHLCRMNILPGISPIKLAIERSNEIPELKEKVSPRVNYSFIFPSNNSATFSLNNSLKATRSILNGRLEKHLLKLPPEVLEKVEIENHKGIKLVTIPMPDTRHYLHFAYIKENPSKINKVYWSRNSANFSPVDVTSEALEFGPYMQINVIWYRYLRFWNRTATGGIKNGSVFSG